MAPQKAGAKGDVATVVAFSRSETTFLAIKFPLDLEIPVNPTGERRVPIKPRNIIKTHRQRRRAYQAERDRIEHCGHQCQPTHAAACVMPSNPSAIRRCRDGSRCQQKSQRVWQSHQGKQKRQNQYPTHHLAQYGFWRVLSRFEHYSSPVLWA